MPFERKWRLTPLHITFGEHNNKWPGILVTLIHYEIYSFSCPWYWHNLCWPLIQHIGSNYIFGFWLPSNLRIFFFCCFYEIEGETSNTMFGGKIEAVIWQTWSQAPSFPYNIQIKILESQESLKTCNVITYTSYLCLS